jgi:peptidoglycan/LPS O-acetylase OafA/YrhL
VPAASTAAAPTAGVEAAPAAMALAHESPSARMRHVDGLRALAALAVALFHFHGYLPRLAAALPRPVDAVVQNGYLGVNVFFVLSGLVISHSLREARYSVGFVARFALRRQLRLDPPYWVALCIASLNLARDPALLPARLAPATLAAHAVYLQGVLGYPNVLDVFWTLCIEVQLYLAFVLLAWAAQALGGSGSTRRALLAVTTLGSLSLAMLPMPERIGAWFVWYWYMFALGVWVGEVARATDSGQRRAAVRWLAGFAALSLLRALRFHGPGPAVCVATAAMLVVARDGSWLAGWLSVRPLVGLGALSYSFYLLHALAGGAAIGPLLAQGPPSLARDCLALGGALAAALLAAALLHRLVEEPAMAWSRRLRLSPPGTRP